VWCDDVMTVSEPAKYTCGRKAVAYHRLHWSDTCLHLFAVGNSELMVEVWLNTGASHLLIRWALWSSYVHLSASTEYLVRCLITALHSDIISHSQWCFCYDCLCRIYLLTIVFIWAFCKL